jgi:hypothetical protein
VSIRRTSTRLTASRSLVGDTEPWVRPSDWLVLPAVAATDQKFVGLMAVYEHGANFVTVQAAGAYTVDWGDGSATTNVATGTTAQKNIAWTDISSGTLTTDGFRQCVVTVTPQAGQTLSNITLSVKHTQSGLVNATSSPWLDMRMAMNNAGTVLLNNSNWKHNLLEQFEWLGTNAQTSLSNFFNGAARLQSVTLSSSSVTVFNGAFINCWSLRNAPFLKTSSGTDFSSMFSGCAALRSVPLYDTSSATVMSSMFLNCASLRRVPKFTTASVMNFSNMFNGCTSLRSIPVLNTSAGTNLGGMFIMCSSLRKVPAIDTSAATSLLNLLNSCRSLTEVPAFNTAACTNFGGMFGDCSSLRSIPTLNTAAGTNFSTMFNNCISLQQIPALNMASGASSASFNSTFANCPSLARSQVTGVAFTHSYTNCALSATALDEIYTNLPTVVGQTITVSGNWGTTGDTPATASGKGWTVAGS